MYNACIQYMFTVRKVNYMYNIHQMIIKWIKVWYTFMFCVVLTSTCTSNWNFWALFFRVQWMTTWRCFYSLAMSSSSLLHFLWLLSGLWSTMSQRFGLMPLRWSTSSRDPLPSQLLISELGRSVYISYLQKYYKPMYYQLKVQSITVLNQ